MCGIAGLYDPNGVKIEEVIALSETLKHRGPDDEGFALIDKDNTVKNCKGNDTVSQLSNLEHIQEQNNNNQLALIHRRLSIIDITEQGHQPFCSSNKRFTLIFNGEIYNYREIRNELLQKGREFTSNSDTEVVLQAFEEWGENCVEKFIGMWAFVIYDLKENNLTISRDRFGIKPLYIYEGKNCFAFASEIKALLKLNCVDKSISNQNLGSYLSFGTTNTPYKNLFEHIKDIEPGCNYTYNLGTKNFAKRSYFSINNPVSPNQMDLNSNIEKFNSIFGESMNLHLRSDVEVGSCLSGGLDSSAIVYFASQLLGDKHLKTFTAAYKNKTVDESEYAHLVASQLNNVKDLYTYPEAKTLVSEMEKLIYYQDLPIGSTSIFAQWEVMKFANSHNIKVLLDGQGADEVLGGYYNFAGIYLIELLQQMKFIQFLKEYHLLKKNFTPQIKNAVLRAAYYYLPKNLQQKLRAKERLSYNFIKKEFIADLDLDIPKRGGKTFNEHVNLSVQYGMYELLRYEDRNSMGIFY